MNKHIKKITAAVLAAAFSAGVWSVPVYAHDVLAYTGGINVNGFRDGEYVGPSWSTEEATGEEAEEMLEFFGLDSTTQIFWYLTEEEEAKYGPIPENYPTSFKIENAAEAEEIYLVGTAEYDLTVHPDGTVTCSEDFETISVESKREMEIYYDGKYITIEVIAKSYTSVWAENYCNQVIDDFIAENITDDMTDYEKMYAVLNWFADLSHCEMGGSEYAVLSGTGAGDCWVYADLTYRACNRLGIPCKRRWANQDLMASSTHRNCAVLLDGVSYIVDTGNSGGGVVKMEKMPDDIRTISSKHKAYEDYLYYEYADGVEIFQYLGFEKNVVCPETINGKPVVMTNTGSFFWQDSVIETLILPDAVVGRIKIESYMPDTTVITYSGTVLQEGYYEIPELPITTTTTTDTTTTITTTTTAETTITTANTTDTTDSDMTTTSGISDTTGSDTTAETTATETITTETITSDTSETTETTTEISAETSTETATETVSSETEVSTDTETSVETVTSETTTTEATGELPQTGYPNSFKLIVPSAFAVTALGAFAVVKSGRLRRKEDEE